MRLQGPAEKARGKSWPTLRRKVGRADPAWQGREGKARRPEAQGRARPGAQRAGAKPSARATSPRRASLAYGVIPQLERRPRRAKAGRCRWSRRPSPRPHRAVVSRWTGIPVDKMLEGEREKLLRMEDALRQARCRPGRSGAGRLRRPCAARAPACRIRTGRSARSCSSARPASARPS
jgi:hypothetical protein